MRALLAAVGTLALFGSTALGAPIGFDQALGPVDLGPAEQNVFQHDLTLPEIGYVPGVDTLTSAQLEITIQGPSTFTTAVVDIFESPDVVLLGGGVNVFGDVSTFAEDGFLPVQVSNVSGVFGPPVDITVTTRLFGEFDSVAGGGSPIPEPATYLTLGAGLLALGLIRRRRTKSAA